MKCVNILPLVGNDVAPPLKLNDDYKLVQIHRCKCGQEHYDVGLKSEYNWVSCYKCKKPLPQGNLIHWCHPDRFE